VDGEGRAIVGDRPAGTSWGMGHNYQSGPNNDEDFRDIRVAISKETQMVERLSSLFAMSYGLLLHLKGAQEVFDHFLPISDFSRWYDECRIERYRISVIGHI